MTRRSQNSKRSRTQSGRFFKAFLVVALSIFAFCASANAREIRYTGKEQVLYVTPGEPTQVNFEAPIAGGFKRTQSSLVLERQNNYLIVFAQPELSPDGEAIIVQLNDNRSYALRIMPATQAQPRDELITIYDTREPEIEVGAALHRLPKRPDKFPPPTTINGFMREIILVAEFGKAKGIPGYRRSNRYSGETVLHDGAIRVTIDEIFMGPDLWGYVLEAENLMESNQKLNPATFRLDGTRAVSASRWELAPRPLTAEQKIANSHRAKVYVITRAARR